jgi:hypothetical protein
VKIIPEDGKMDLLESVDTEGIIGIISSMPVLYEAIDSKQSIEELEEYVEGLEYYII